MKKKTYIHFPEDGSTPRICVNHIPPTGTVVEMADKDGWKELIKSPRHTWKMGQEGMVIVETPAPIKPPKSYLFVWYSLAYAVSSAAAFGLGAWLF